MNILEEYRGHSIEVKPFAFTSDRRGVVFPSLHDVFVDGVRRGSGFLEERDAQLYGRTLIDEENEHRRRKPFDWRR